MSSPTPAVELWVWSNNSGLSVSLDSTVFWGKFLFAPNSHVMEAKCNLCQSMSGFRGRQNPTVYPVSPEREKNKIDRWLLFDGF